jgi:hypothetical protein
MAGLRFCPLNMLNHANRSILPVILTEGRKDNEVFVPFVTFCQVIPKENPLV